MLEREEDRSSLELREVLFIIFKKKLTIVFFAIAGSLAAAFVWLVTPPLYKSEAKLFVPYVVERNAVDAAEEATATNRASDAIINSEVKILTSLDLAARTASSIPRRNLRGINGTGTGSSEAAHSIAKRIEVNVEKGMNVITVSYKDNDPQSATNFLRELLKNYREKHLEVHRFPQALDLIVQRRDEVRKQLDRTEAELKQLKNTVQSLSAKEGTDNLGAAISRAQDELNTAEADRKGQEARVAALESLLPAGTLSSDQPTKLRATDQITERHRFLVQLLYELRTRERSLLAVYPADSRMVKIAQKQIGELESQRRDFERRYPELSASDPVGENLQTQSNLPNERARLAAMRATEEVLSAQLQDLHKRREQFTEIAPDIARLELNKQVLEASYKNIETNLGKAQDDRAVDWSKISNIASVQEPSPGIKEPDRRTKVLVLGLAGGGLVLGLGLALVSELMLDRTIKRPVELERDLHIPLLLSIPFMPALARARRMLGFGKRDSLVPPETHEPLNTEELSITRAILPFCEAIRDRMILSFELRRINRKPKLIGVTGLSKGAGSSTLASGLASALSDIGAGKVLLVDMNSRDGDVPPCFEGKEAVSLASILEEETRPPADVDNLYLATVDAANTERTSIGLSRFSNLVPSLKAADFDYIIFDMASMGAISPSLSLAALMDKVLLVIEAEQSDRDVTKRYYSELMDLRVDVSCVFNKARAYGPKWLGAEN